MNIETLPARLREKIVHNANDCWLWTGTKVKGHGYVWWEGRKRYAHRVIYALLVDNDRCTIHPVAPFGCSYFDVHMPFDEAHERSLWTVRRQMEPEYQALRRELPSATHHKPLNY